MVMMMESGEGQTDCLLGITRYLLNKVLSNKSRGDEWLPTSHYEPWYRVR